MDVNSTDRHVLPNRVERGKICFTCSPLKPAPREHEAEQDAEQGGNIKPDDPTSDAGEMR